VLPVYNTTNTADPSYKGSWVAEVTMANRIGALIDRYQAMKGFHRRLRTAWAMVKKFSNRSPHHDAKQLARAEERLKRVNAAHAEVGMRLHS